MSVESDKALSVYVDLLVIGGGTAGSVAAIKGKEALPGGEVLLLEKANVKRSGAIALGMDGVKNAGARACHPGAVCQRDHDGE